MKKGIILAGGSGTRLYPITQVVTKQLLPVYDKPMIYYPLSLLMLMGIRRVLIITKPEDIALFADLLGDGSHLGISIEYKIQDAPRGLPDAFALGRDFIDNDPVTLILGDNIFYGAGMVTYLTKRLEEHKGASIFTYQVQDPERFGVVNFHEDGSVSGLEEKPKKPKSRDAMVGLYHFDPDVCDKVIALKPSARGELEMVDLLNAYLEENRLKSFRMARGFAWLDTGTYESMLKAAQYIQIIEERQNFKIACIEEIAYLMKFIDADQLRVLAEPLKKSGYGEYLLQVLDG